MYYHRTAYGTAQRLVGGGGDHISELEGRGDGASRHQTRHVRDIRQQDGVVSVGDLKLRETISLS